MATRKTVHTVILEKRKNNIRTDMDARFEQERQAFWAMHAQLLSRYEGKYVAVLNGQVVDSDADEQALVNRVYQKFGYQPIYVQLVMAGRLPVHRINSPKLVKR